MRSVIQASVADNNCRCIYMSKTLRVTWGALPHCGSHVLISNAPEAVITNW